MIIDTHAHYDDEWFEEDREKALSELNNKNVELVVNAAASVESCKSTMELIDKYPFVYGMQGIHPDSVGELTDADMDLIRRNAKNPKIVAIGEIGLDYHWDIAPRDVQKHWFKEQMSLAREVKLPICIHSRDAAQDTIMMMEQEDAASIGGVVHCYSYSAELAKEILSMDFYFGIGGVVTFKNGRKCKETVEAVPMNRILLETDAPYLAPEPFRGKRNQSEYLQYVAEMIGQIKGITTEEVIAITNENAKKLYTKLVSK